MTPRLAQRRDVKGGLYLVAKDCPHAVPAGAPFYACVAGLGKTTKDAVILCCCEHTRREDVAPVDADNDNGDRLVICRFGDAPEPRGVQFGVPTVAHVADVSDGGDKD